MVLHARPERGGGFHPFAALPLGRQRACGTEELDVGAPAFGVWAPGRPGDGGSDQRVVSGGLGAMAELLFALFKAGAEVAGRQSLAQTLRTPAHRLPAALRSGHADAKTNSALAGAL